MGLHYVCGSTTYLSVLFQGFLQFACAETREKRRVTDGCC